MLYYYGLVQELPLLSARDLVVTSPVIFDTPSIGQGFNIHANNFINTSPSFDQASFNIILHSTSFTVATPPTFTTSIIKQILFPNNFDVSSPFIDTPNLIIFNILHSSNFISSSPNISNAQISPAIIPSPFTTALPTFGSPTFGQTQILHVDPSVLSSPIFSSANFGYIQYLFSADFVSSSPIFDIFNPVVVQVLSAYVNREVIQFKTKFYEFRDVHDANIAMAFMMADDFVDWRMWPSLRDFNNARMYYAAHLLALQIQAQKNINTPMTFDLFMESIEFGERRVSYGSRPWMSMLIQNAAPGEAFFNLTIYGQNYLQLRARNIIAVAVV